MIGVSILSGAHLTLFPRIATLMKDRGLDDVVLLAGGVIPDEDLPQLAELGVASVVGQEATPDAIVASVRSAVAERGKARA